MQQAVSVSTLKVMGPYFKMVFSSKMWFLSQWDLGPAMKVFHLRRKPFRVEKRLNLSSWESISARWKMSDSRLSRYLVLGNFILCHTHPPTHSPLSHSLSLSLSQSHAHIWSVKHTPTQIFHFIFYRTLVQTLLIFIFRIFFHLGTYTIFQIKLHWSTCTTNMM